MLVNLVLDLEAEIKLRQEITSLSLGTLYQVTFSLPVIDFVCEKTITDFNLTALSGAEYIKLNNTIMPGDLKIAIDGEESGKQDPENPIQLSFIGFGKV